jgi:hypothetical protein
VALPCEGFLVKGTISRRKRAVFTRSRAAGCRCAARAELSGGRSPDAIGEYRVSANPFGDIIAYPILGGATSSLLPNLTFSEATGVTPTRALR